MNKASRKKWLSILALAAALVIPALLPQSAHGMYDPKHGRWLQRDPLGYVDGSNLHEYGKSSPVVFLDPNGTDVIGDCDCEDIIKIAAIKNYSKRPAGKGLVRYFTREVKYDIVMRSPSAGAEWQQIVMGMLLSEYTFKLIDGKPRSWASHIAARQAVVSRARSLAALAHIPLVPRAQEKYNPVYWSGSGALGWNPKDDNKAAQALTDPWDKPTEYAVGCAIQTMLILGAAAVDYYGAGAITEAWKNRSEGDPQSLLMFVRSKYYTQRGEKSTLWIPGDRGYFASSGVGYNGPAGEGGIYQGWFVISVESDYARRVFWVFAPASSGDRIVTTTDVEHWTNQHYDRSHPGAWEPNRLFPKAGLEE